MSCTPDDLAQAEARGEARILAKVRQMPSPWDEQCSSADPETDEATVQGFCRWCAVVVNVETSYRKFLSAWEITKHPDNDCLWAVADRARATRRGE